MSHGSARSIENRRFRSSLGSPTPRRLPSLTRCLAALSLGAALTAPGTAQPLAFAVDASGTDRLHALELALGASFPLGPTGFDHIGALTFAPDGELLGFDETTGSLVRLDRGDGSGHLLGVTGLGTLRGTGLTFDEEGRLWLADALHSKLHELDPRTGEVLRSKATAIPATGLATIGPRLYALSLTEPGSLLSLEPESPMEIAPEPLGFLRTSEGAGLAADLDGNLWAVAPEGAIFRVDAGTGRAKDISTTVRGMHSLAILRQPICALGVDPDLTDLLFALDFTSGNVIQRGLLPFDAVTGLCRANDGRLLGVDTLTNRLIEIDERNGDAEAIGTLGVSVQDAALAMDALGRLWLLTETRKIYEVDAVTGEARLRSENGPPVDGLTARGTTLYGLGRDTLYTIDANTLAWRAVGPLVHVGANDAGLAFDPHGNLYGCSDGRDLFLVSPTTGVGIPVGRTLVGIEGLVMQTSCTVGPERFLPNRADLRLDESDPGRDRFTLSGKISPVGMIDDLTNVVVLLWLDGYGLPLIPVLDERGRFSFPRGHGPWGRFEIDARRGTFQYQLRDANLVELLQLDLPPGIRERWLDVRLVISGAALEQSTFHSRLPFTLETRGEKTRGKFRLAQRQPVGGHFTIEDVRTQSRTAGKARLAVEARLSPRALSRLRLRGPREATVLRIEAGATEPLEIPLEDLRTTPRGYRLERHRGGPLAFLDIDTRRGRLRMRTNELEELESLARASATEPIVLELGLHFEAQSGRESFVVPVELEKHGRTWRTK